MRKLIFSAVLVVGSLTALSQAGVAQMTQKDSREADERRICRNTQVTGKLAASRRVCLTKAEWDRAHEEQRKVAQRAVHALDSCSARAEGGGCSGY